MPVDVQIRVVPGYGTFGLGMIELIALVLEDGLMAQYCKAVGEAFGDEELQTEG